jgi:prephenate dehydrogenase
LAKLQHGTTSSNPQLAASMHAAFNSLQEAVAAARQHLSSMQQLAEECAEAALAAPLQDEQKLRAGEDCFERF